MAPLYIAQTDTVTTCGDSVVLELERRLASLPLQALDGANEGEGFRHIFQRPDFHDLLAELRVLILLVAWIELGVEQVADRKTQDRLQPGQRVFADEVPVRNPGTAG